jgi:hypothetical protein
MSEHRLDLRLRAVAEALDAEAPPFDASRLRGRPRATVAALAATVALLGVVAAPAAVSALRDLFVVESVPVLGPAPEVAPPFQGRAVSPGTVAFPVELGPPDAAFVRDDVVGGMVTLVYDGASLTQWRTSDVDARVEVVPAAGTADEVTIADGRAGLWIEGAARGTFTVVGADGAIHHERFDVGPGALLWEDTGRAFLLQGAGSKAEAVELAARASPG